MKYAKRIGVFSLMLTLLAPTGIIAQREVGIPIKKQQAYVIEFKPPYDKMVIDIGDNNFIETESLDVPISPQTTFKNKDKTVDRALVRPGMDIIIEGERFSNRIVPSEIKVLTALEKWDVEVKGYFERLEGDKAWVDGKAVKLVPGTVVKGVDEWKNKKFASFDEMQLGSEVWLKGVRRTDGMVYATEGKTEPNIFTPKDRELKEAAEKGVKLPANLVGGKGTVNGREVKFVNNRQLQTYVTAVGNRIIPRYYKDQPNDYPGKLTFRFAVIEDDSFNAFATPDGFIAIHTGLLKRIRNEAQLAAILGHEIAHVTHEHSRRTSEDWTKTLFVLGGALASSAAGGKDGGAALMTALAFATQFDRDQEDQADRVGLHYMTEAGYDPREAPKVWREIARNTKPATTSGQALQSLYSSHSSARQRLKYLNRAIAYSYYGMEFNGTKIGEGEYTNAMNGTSSATIGSSKAVSPNLYPGNSGLPATVQALPLGNNAKAAAASKTSSCQFCGVWQYDQTWGGQAPATKDYLKIMKIGTNTFRLITGYSYEGQIVWQDDLWITNADGIYLKNLKGKLTGRFVSANFRATRAVDFVYMISCALRADGAMHYTVRYNSETERYIAKRIGVSTEAVSPQSGNSSRSTRRDDFEAFLTKFRSAVTRQNKTSLKSLMSSQFDWALDGYGSPDEAMQKIGQYVGWSKFWQSAKKAVARKPVKCSNTQNLNDHSGFCAEARSPFPIQLVFERIGGSWYWTAFPGH